MNRIVKHHVPVGELPEHLREGLDPAGFATVEVTIEPTSTGDDETPMSLNEIFGLRDNFASAEEVDAYVRSLREEWAHRER
ncbi:hypothetical protein [Salinarimonas ramus]|uniref:Uncharacterized protein n=1 Tax=Salinarimonas ramus TaxID=690164 RepID=A0A917V5K5_9HYPH|nr:hypothetical protein [Salinarimonas ramus]GGK39872.1 hypothetical protein GCM10011322_28760 [Salinarimonas ramus]